MDSKEHLLNISRMMKRGKAGSEKGGSNRSTHVCAKEETIRDWLQELSYATIFPEYISLSDFYDWIFLLDLD